MYTKSVWNRILSVIMGIIYIAFGSLLMRNPGVALKSLSWVLAWGTIIAGVLMFINAIRDKDEADQTIPRVVEAILIVVLGSMFLSGKYINNTLVLAYLLLFWNILDSMLQIQFLVKLPKRIWTLLVIIMDIVIIVYSFFLIFNPGLAEVMLIFYIGIGFIATGATKIIREM